VHSIARLGALSLSVLALSATGVAVAGPGDNPAQPVAGATAATSPAALPAGVPKGYVSLQSALLAAPAHLQTRGNLSCPAGKVPLGGGALVSSADLAANVNSSFPDGDKWTVDVNNGASFNTTFRIFVICAKAPKLYQTVDVSATAPAGITNHAIANCPTGTVVIGGGALSTSGSVLTNIADTFPAGNAWRVDMNNATTSANTLVSRAICAKKPKGYTLVVGSNSDIFAHSSASASAFCPGVTVPLSGGVVNFLDDVQANMNATFPTNADGWFSEINNAGIGNAIMSTRMICAGV
jgi:hypothetical protein